MAHIQGNEHIIIQLVSLIGHVGMFFNSTRSEDCLMQTTGWGNNRVVGRRSDLLKHRISMKSIGTMSISLELYQVGTYCTALLTPCCQWHIALCTISASGRRVPGVVCLVSTKNDGPKNKRRTSDWERENMRL